MVGIVQLHFRIEVTLGGILHESLYHVRGQNRKLGQEVRRLPCGVSSCTSPMGPHWCEFCTLVSTTSGDRTENSARKSLSPMRSGIG